MKLFFYLQKLNYIYNLINFVSRGIMMKIYYNIIILLFFINSCSTKVNTIKDDFYGITYYQTDYISVKNWDTTINLRLVSKEKNNIVLEAQYISSSAFTITEENKIVLKFSDDSFIYLNYTDNVKKLNKEEVYKTIKGWFFDTDYIDTYLVNASSEIYNLGILTDIRLENSEAFKNIKFPEDKAHKLLELFNEIKSIN